MANKYIENSKPWTLAKDGRTEELAGVIYNLLEALRISSLCLYPFMPKTAQGIWAQLGMEGAVEKATRAEGSEWGAWAEGSKVNRPEPLFPRIEAK